MLSFKLSSYETLQLVLADGRIITIDVTSIKGVSTCQNYLVNAPKDIKINRVEQADYTLKWIEGKKRKAKEKVENKRFLLIKE